MLHEEFRNPFIFGIGVIVAKERRMDGDVDEEGAEDVQNPAKLRDGCCADADHDAAEDEGTDNAPE